MKSPCRQLTTIAIAASILTIAAAAEGPSVRADERGPIPAADLVNDGKLKLEFTGTGKTIGHVMDVQLINLTGEPIQVIVPPMLLVSTGRDAQDYAAPLGHTASVGGGTSVTVPIIGVCLIRTRPAVGAGVTGGTLAMTSSGELLNSLPEDFAPSAEQQEELDNFTVKNVGELLTIAESIYLAAEELEEEGELKGVPYPNANQREEIVIEWVIWANPEIAIILDQEPATQEDLGEVINDQVAEKFEDEVPPAVQEKVDIGIEDIFASVELTQERAKKIRQKSRPADSDFNIDDDPAIHAPLGVPPGEFNGPPRRDEKGNVLFNESTGKVLREMSKPPPLPTRKKYVPFKTTVKKDGTVVSTKTENGIKKTVTQYPDGSIKIELNDTSRGETRILIYSQDSIKEKLVDAQGKEIVMTDAIKKELGPAEWFIRKIFTKSEDGSTTLTLWVDKATKLVRIRHNDGSTSSSTTSLTNGGKSTKTTTVERDSDGVWVGTTVTTVETTSRIPNRPITGQDRKITVTVYKKNQNGEATSTTTTKNASWRGTTLHSPDYDTDSREVEEKVDTTTTVYRPNGKPKRTTYVRADKSREVIVNYDKEGKPKKVTTTTRKTTKKKDEYGMTDTIKKRRVEVTTFDKAGKPTTKVTEYESKNGGKEKIEGYPDVPDEFVPKLPKPSPVLPVPSVLILANRN